MIAIRPARPDDLDFLVELLNAADVDPFLSPRGRDRESLAAELDRMREEPDAGGRVVIEVDGERAGAMAWEVAIARHGIVHLGGLAVHRDFRGRGVADEAARLLQRHLLLERGFHRLQLECYAFNDRAVRHAERAGFVREGVKRNAYLRDGEWVSSVMFALVREDLDT